MKKLFFIALFTIGLTTTMNAQCVDQNDAPGSTGYNGFLESFTFGNDIVDIGIDIPSGTFAIDVAFGYLINMGTYYGPTYPASGVTYYWAGFNYGGYTYYFDVSVNPSTGNIIDYYICR